MARKNYAGEYLVIKQGDMTLPLISEISEVNFQDRILYVAKWTSTGIAAELIIEFSDDKENWTVLDFGTPIPINLDNSDHQIIITQATFKYIRARLIPTAGTGLLDIAFRATTQGA